MQGGSVSSACLLRQVSSGLSRNCKDERRPDVEEAWLVAMNFMAWQLEGHDRYRLSGTDGEGEKIAAQILSKEIGSGYFQETHPYRLFELCRHYCELVSDPPNRSLVSWKSAFRPQPRTAGSL